MLSPEEKLGKLAYTLLLHGSGTLIIHWDSETHHYSASQPGSKGPRHIEADCPLLLIQGILGCVRTKRCLGACGLDKPLTAFARAGESEESRAAVCGACERAVARKKPASAKNSERKGSSPR